MKLAEALNLRSTLIKQILGLKSRLVDCVSIPEGENPIDSAEELLKEVEPLIEQLHQLVFNINLTNLQVKDNGKSITELLAERDALSMRTQILNDCLIQLKDNKRRYRPDDLKFIQTVEPSVLREMHSKEASKLRQLNLKIQMLGWMNDLIEG